MVLVNYILFKRVEIYENFKEIITRTYNYNDYILFYVLLLNSFVYYKTQYTYRRRVENFDFFFFKL